MEKNVQAILHKKSAALAQNGIDPKLPEASQLEYGELAINFADGHETLSIKNNNNEIVTFTNDLYWKDKELVISSALNDLNSRILAITVPTNISDLVNDVPYLTASDLDDTPTEDSDNGVTSGGVYDYITEIEEATSAALNDLNERIDDIPSQVQADWNQTTTTATDYIKNKPIVRTIINLEDELPSRLINAIGEENAITLTAEEASQLEALKVKLRSNDSNGYPYVYMLAGMQVYPDVDATYNYIIRFDGIDFLRGGVRSLVSISIEHNNDGNFSAGDDAWIDSLVDHITTNNGYNNYVKKSNTVGLIKNDGTIDTNNYIISSNVATTVTEDDPNPVSGGAVYNVIVENEQITSAALNDLNERINNIPELPENIVTGASTAYTIWCGTQTEYDALLTYDNNTVYLIKENA